MNGVFDDIYEVAEEGLSPIVQDPANRDRSWDRCYTFFRKYHENQAQRDTNSELACLHLGFYLASWGMFRGSGPLMHKDYTIYRPLIDLLLRDEYQELWNVNLFQGLLESEDTIPADAPLVGLVFRLAGEIQQYIRGLTIIRGPGKPQEPARCTDTIVTKILLGTLGCTPAYDENFKKGLRKYEVHPYNSDFSRNSLVNLLNTCREARLWQKLSERPIECPGVDPRLPLPLMRVVDLYFWFEGYSDP